MTPSFEPNSLSEQPQKVQALSRVYIQALANGLAHSPNISILTLSHFERHNGGAYDCTHLLTEDKLIYAHIGDNGRRIKTREVQIGVPVVVCYP